MRIYSNFLEAIKEIERDLFEMGVNSHPPTIQDLNVKDNPDYDSKELIGYGYVVMGGFNTISQIIGFSFPDNYDKILKYCTAEFLDRISPAPRNPGYSWLERMEYWNKFLHDGKFSYSYSERMFDQSYKIISELKKNKESRQCIVPIYKKEDNLKWGGKERVPCSMYYHFLIRNISGIDRLFLIYTMRASDFYTHFPIDIWLAVEYGKWIGGNLGVSLYSFTHFIDSLHAFKKDFGKRRIF